MGEVITSWNGDGVLRGESLTAHIRPMKLYRVKKGAIIAGVCKGLEASGKGTANGWRVLFLISGTFFFVPIIGYAVMALLLPQKNTSAEVSGIEETPYEDMEKSLERLEVLKKRGLISDEEFKLLRRRAMGG